MHAGLAVEAGLDVARLGDLAEVHLDEVAVLGALSTIGRTGATLPPSDVGTIIAVGVILAPPAHSLRHGFILDPNSFST